MIILDTNVISEVTLRQPDFNVLTWLSIQQRRLMFTTSISQAEMFYGIRVLPEGKRRQELENTARGIFFEDFAGRVLAFDVEAADIYATISAKRRALGRPIRELDAQIASIALLNGASLATRNVRDFEYLDLDIINPWNFRG
jgi:predicted nucleic acid-binding protein